VRASRDTSSVKEASRNWLRKARKNGTCRYGYTKQIIKRFSHADLTLAFDAVREAGKIAAAYDVLGQWRGRALLYFHPKLHKQIKKLAHSKPRLVCRPAIIISPANASQLIESINAAVPRTLPQDMRDDIIGEMTLAVIEGRLKIQDVARRMTEFVRASFKTDHNKWGALSLDQPMFEDGTVTLGDTVIRGLWGA
jgi:hypothetical protein